MSSPFDLAIVGGGATGLAAAIQAGCDGLRTVLLERGSLGGRIREQVLVEVAPGLPLGPTGEEFAAQALSTAIRLGVEIRSAAEVVALEVRGDVKRLGLADGRPVDARAVIVAAGAEYPDLGIPGIREFTGRGVYFGAPVARSQILRDGEVFVTGDPDAATVAAARLAAEGARATIVQVGQPARRRTGGKTGERPGHRGQVAESPRFRVVEAVGVHRLETLVLRDLRTGRTLFRNASALFVLGIDRPRTGWLEGTLALDARGYVLTGDSLRHATPGRVGCTAGRPRRELESSERGVFAAGGARGVRDCCVESVGVEGVWAARQAFEHVREL